MLALLVGTWSGWDWDVGLVKSLMEWQRRKNIDWMVMELKQSKASEDIKRGI